MLDNQGKDLEPIGKKVFTSKEAPGICRVVRKDLFAHFCLSSQWGHDSRRDMTMFTWSQLEAPAVCSVVTSGSSLTSSLPFP